MTTRQGSPIQAALLLAMIFCVVFEGLIIAISGFPFKGMPIEVYVVGIIWVGICAATFYYPKKPLYALLAGWVMLLATSISTSKNPAVSHSALGYLYQHSIELLYIAASHLGFLMTLRNRPQPGR